tara:strand:- start:211 stop:621 length:411 start_codon:yes stop_codon:yes gene_type:complete
MKKILIAILLIICIQTKAQHSTKYKEVNIGVYVAGGQDFIFPGTSFLWGKTIHFSSNFLIDYEYGLALPTLFTGKIGCGIGNENNSLIAGVRPFPPSLYLQYTLKEKHLISTEIMHDQSASNIYDLPLIINYGFRW